MHRKKVHREIILIELVSLHPPADDNLVSKKVANFTWTYRLFRASFGIGILYVAKQCLGQSYVRHRDYICAG